MPNFTIEKDNKVEIMWSLLQKLRSQIANLLISGSNEVRKYYSVTEALNEPNPWKVDLFIVREAVNPQENGIYYFKPGINFTVDNYNIFNMISTTDGQLIRQI